MRPTRLTAACALTLALAGTAFADPHPMFLHRQAPQPSQAAPTMLYYGGPVFSQVKVVSVMWGPKVNATVVANIGGFYTAVTNSTWFDILAQYATNLTGVDGHPGTNQTISRGSFAGQVVIAPHNTATTLSNAAVEKELLVQIKTKKLPKPDANTLYMIYFPPGVTITLGKSASCSAFGAYHEGFTSKAYGGVFFGVMPDCGFNFAGTSIVSSHELAEATTDNFPTPGSHPAYPQAWNNATGSEIGDLCEGTSGAVASATKTYSVQQVFSNLTNACSTGNYTSP